MNKRLFSRTLLALLVGTLCLTACQPEETTIDIDQNLLIGTWYATDNPQEYWRYDATFSGETWDESEDVQEGEGIKYYWEVKNKQLQLDFYGEMGQHVYNDYAFTAQDSFSFTWKDLYGNARTFNRTSSNPLPSDRRR